MTTFKNLKLLCIDNDDVMFNSSPLIQYHVERNFPKFSTDVLKNRERTINALNYQYNLMKKEIEEAIKEGREPNLPNFNIVKNDVIRERANPSGDFAYDYYYRPLIELGECIKQAQWDKEMFLEERDATIEKDGKLAVGVIPYDLIYSERNWMPYVRRNIQALYKVFGERLISLTAHNGIDDMHGREFEAKGEAVHKMVKELEHYGLRFHDTEYTPEHNDIYVPSDFTGVRRQRASKAERIMQLYGLDDLFGAVNVDDSVANCLDWFYHGGSPILISQNKSNDYGFATAKSLKPESIYRELERLGFGDSNSNSTILQKPKVLKK